HSRRKGVTILERGTTSTRWRDYVDIVGLANTYGVDSAVLLDSARAAARYRQVELRPVATLVEGYAEIGQAKWAAWRRKEGVEDVSEENLDDQMAKVIAIWDPVFASGPGH
ncbi:MAG TPA: nucleotidyl transferase AbiEii/AbiGii toxin family protein, partial [Actinophytocola sp.]|nr:nucleotidyl transferase AbiEii/AbiGii toxin family protein [Actinophytocola sp.]